MRRQFIILVITAFFLVLGWTIIEYLLQSQIQFQYNQLEGYPVIIYSWEDSLLTVMQNKLLTLSYVKGVEYKTSEQSTAELIRKYNLQGAEDILQQKTLPSVLIIYLKGSFTARSDKYALKDFLAKSAPAGRMMIEYQTDIWNKTLERIDQITQIRWILLAFLSAVIFLVFFFKRLHYEHRLARIRHLLEVNPADAIPPPDRYWVNSLLLVLLPVGFSYLLYEISYFNDWLLYSLPWYFFLIQLGVLAGATLLAYPFEVKYRRETDHRIEPD